MKRLFAICLVTLLAACSNPNAGVGVSGGGGDVSVNAGVSGDVGQNSTAYVGTGGAGISTSTGGNTSVYVGTDGAGISVGTGNVRVGVGTGGPRWGLGWGW